MTGKQLTLNFDNAVTLIDKDGDKFVFNVADVKKECGK